MMDQDRFEALADAYGGDMQRWPTECRGEAQAFAAAHPEVAETVLTAAQALDAILADAVQEPPSDALYHRIVADGMRARPLSRPAWAAAAAAVMLTVGLGAGWLAAPSTVGADEDVFALAFGAFESADTLSLEEEV